MAICLDCDQEMRDEAVRTCSVGTLRLNGQLYSRVPYGDPREGGFIDHSPRCHDCNVPPGGFHHHGCDVERCPRCGLQLIGCDCEED